MRLTQEQTNKLNVPVTIEEISQAITKLELGKAPGPDGYSPDYYKILKEQQEGTLLQVYIPTYRVSSIRRIRP